MNPSLSAQTDVEPSAWFDTAHELSPNLVLFVPMDDKRVAIMLPILPALIVYNDDGYKRFVNAFLRVFFRRDTMSDEPVGQIWIEHERIGYRFSALNSFIEAMDHNKEVIVVPYSPEEGLPQQDVFGAVIPVYDRDKADDVAAMAHFMREDKP